MPSPACIGLARQSGLPRRMLPLPLLCLRQRHEAKQAPSTHLSASAPGPPLLLVVLCVPQVQYRHDDEGPDDMPAHVKVRAQGACLLLSRFFSKGGLLGV